MKRIAMVWVFAAAGFACGNKDASKTDNPTNASPTATAGHGLVMDKTNDNLMVQVDEHRRLVWPTRAMMLCEKRGSNETCHPFTPPDEPALVPIVGCHCKDDDKCDPMCGYPPPVKGGSGIHPDGPGSGSDSSSGW